MAGDARDEIAAEQAALLAALNGEGPVPEGFDPARVKAALHGLRNKRVRSAARAWPALASALGEGFASEFARHVASTPLATEQGPLTDGQRLFQALEGDPRLGAAARLEGLHVRLRYAVVPEGLRVRRGLSVAFARFPGAVVVGVRWREGTRVLRLGG